MAAPMMMAGLGASAGGGLLGAFGSLTKGSAEQDYYNYQAGVNLVNAKLAKENAEYERASGDIEAQFAGIRSRQQMGSIIAQQGASGADVNSGSNLDVQQSQQKTASAEQTLIQASAARRAYGSDVEAAKQRSEAMANTMAGKNAKKAGQIGALGSILGGASSVSGKWAQGRQVGAW